MYGRKHLRDDSAADDLAQQVLLVTIERLRAGEVRTPDEIGSFILGTSRMLAGSMRRTAGAARSLTAQFHAPAPAVEPDDRVGRYRRGGAVPARARGARPPRADADVLCREDVARDSRRSSRVTGTGGRVARHRALERLRHCVGVRDTRQP
jgi:RNA polymerase sigma-70 factor (ECF subfamily)